MLSLRKVKSEDEVETWRKTLGGDHLVVMPKFDGLAVTFAIYLESYQKKDGSQGTATRLRPMDPRKGKMQLPVKALEQIKKAEEEAEGPDEVPF